MLLVFVLIRLSWKPILCNPLLPFIQKIGLLVRTTPCFSSTAGTGPAGVRQERREGRRRCQLPAYQRNPVLAYTVSIAVLYEHDYHLRLHLSNQTAS